MRISKNVDLGVVPDWMKSAPVSAPSVPAQEMKPQYPDVYIEGVEELELPDSGTITFRYEVTREVTEKKSGKEKCNYNLKLLKLISAVPDAGAEEDDEELMSAEEAVDKALKK
jgi:hypothetical protein